MAYRSTHASNNIHTTAAVVILAVGTARVRLEYLFVTMSMFWLPFVAFGSGTRTFIVSNCNSAVAEKSYGWRLCLSVIPLEALFWQLLTVLYALLSIFGHKYSFFMVSYI